MSVLIFDDSVGRAKHEKVMITTNEQDVYIGDVIVIHINHIVIGKIQRSVEVKLSN